jgi:Calcium/calmodulin dependent protein kinase II association domain
VESLEEGYHAARRLADDVAVVSLVLTQKATRDGIDRSGEFYVVDIWKKRLDRWQIVARYSSPMAKAFDRSR